MTEFDGLAKEIQETSRSHAIELANDLKRKIDLSLDAIIDSENFDVAKRFIADLREIADKTESKIKNR